MLQWAAYCSMICAAVAVAAGSVLAGAISLPVGALSRTRTARAGGGFEDAVPQGVQFGGCTVGGAPVAVYHGGGEAVARAASGA